MPRGCLWFVIVVIPDHTHLLFFISVWSEIMSLKSNQLELGFSLSQQKVQRSQITMPSYETFYRGLDHLPKYPLLRIKHVMLLLNLDLFCSSLLSSPYLCIISLLYLDLYVLEMMH